MTKPKKNPVARRDFLKNAAVRCGRRQMGKVVAIKGKLGYQACDSKTCFLPRRCPSSGICRLWRATERILPAYYLGNSNVFDDAIEKFAGCLRGPN